MVVDLLGPVADIRLLHECDLPGNFRSTSDIEKELKTRLKRHAYAVWQEVNTRESTMDDD